MGSIVFRTGTYVQATKYIVNACWHRHIIETESTGLCVVASLCNIGSVREMQDFEKQIKVHQPDAPVSSLWLILIVLHRFLSLKILQQQSTQRDTFTGTVIVFLVSCPRISSAIRVSAYKLLNCVDELFRVTSSPINSERIILFMLPEASGNI